ncbi:MAG: hypothetical protein H0X33_14100 [Taibaiella sp.]|nr:hypothetical protein [Taibaiella sp.]
MAKTMGSFIGELMKKAGVDPTLEIYKGFFTHPQLEAIEVTDEVLKAIDNNLISLAAAKNNHTDIKNHYTKQALDGIDKSLDDLMNELELDDATKNQVLVERSTYKKPAALIKVIKQLETAKATASAPDKAAINKQLEELHAQIKVEKDNSVKAKNDYDRQLSEFKKEIKVSGLYANEKTVLDTLDPEARNTAINVLINKALQDNNAKITFDENNNLVLTKNDGTNYFGDNNQQVTPKQFVEQTLSRNKLLVTTQAPPPSNGANGSVNNVFNGQSAAPASGSTANGNNSAAATIKELNAQALKDMASSNSQPAFGAV